MKKKEKMLKWWWKNELLKLRQRSIAGSNSPKTKKNSQNK